MVKKPKVGYKNCPVNTSNAHPTWWLAWEGNTNRRKDNRDRCSYNFIISSVCGTPRRLAVAVQWSALINISLGRTEPMTSLLLRCTCKPPPPNQSALQRQWRGVWKISGTAAGNRRTAAVVIKNRPLETRHPEYRQTTSNSPSAIQTHEHTRT